VFCVLQGARIVRTHNVRQTGDAMRMVEAILGWREPVYLLHNIRPEGND
jgi:dihydropteroate synthase